MATTSVGGARPRRAASCRPYRLGVLLRVLDPENPSPPDAGDALLTLELPPGRWVPPPMLVRADLDLFVLSGVLLASRPAPRGPRVDLQFPSELVGLDTLPARRWQVISQHPARLAVVAATGLDSLGATPGGTVALLAAGQRQLERARDLHAIVGIQRIEERITAYFAFLAAQSACRAMTGDADPAHAQAEADRGDPQRRAHPGDDGLPGVVRERRARAGRRRVAFHPATFGSEPFAPRARCGAELDCRDCVDALS